MNKEFAVKSQSFETYERFKKDIEEIGYTYLEKFKPFDKDSLANTTCFFIAESWIKTNDFLFSFSNAEDDTDVYDIDHEYAYNMAIEHATNLIVKRSKVNVTLSEIAKWKNCDVADIQISL